MTTTPADELRAAAELLRAAALAAAEHSGSTTWYSKRHHPNQDTDFTVLTAGPGRPLHCGGGGGGRGPAPYMHAPVSEYIAAVGPGVGLAIADWLGSWTGVDLSEHGPAPEDAQHALAVARQILGTIPAATGEQGPKGLNAETTTYIVLLREVPTAVTTDLATAQAIALADRTTPVTTDQYENRWDEHAPGEWRLMTRRRDRGGRWTWTQRAVRAVPLLNAETAEAPVSILPAPAPLSEVWTVWREDEPVYGHFATVDAARQGTIDCWQEDEPSCPDYSWHQQASGNRLELLVGGVHSGVYASRHPVYGGPTTAPTDRAATIRAIWEPLLPAVTEETTPAPTPCTNPCIACMADESHDPDATEEPTR